MHDDLTKTDDIEALRRLAIEAWQRAEALQKQAEALVQEKAVLVSQTKELKAKNKALEDELTVLLQRISDLTCKLAAATNRDQRRQLELELRHLRQKLAQHASETYGSSTSERMPSQDKDEPKAKRALDLIGQLYAVEEEATEAARGDPVALLAHRRRLREQRSRGIVAELELWQQSQRAMPRSQFHEGLQFLANHWTHLKRFLDDPRIPLDNGEAEREIRGPVVGRKNFYGNRSELGAAVAGLFYSLLGTANKLGLNPEEYLTTAALRALHNPGTVTLPQDYQAELDATS